jgi:urease subunit beta
VKEVRLIPYGGRRTIYGFNGLVMGRLDDPYTRQMSLKRCVDGGFGHKASEPPKSSKAPKSSK